MHGKGSGASLVLQSASEGETNKSTRHNGQSDGCGQWQRHVVATVHGRNATTLCTVAGFDKTGMTSTLGRWRFWNTIGGWTTWNGCSIHGLGQNSSENYREGKKLIRLWAGGNRSNLKERIFFGYIFFGYIFFEMIIVISVYIGTINKMKRRRRKFISNAETLKKKK